MSGQRKLTTKETAFVREYLVDFNATQAAIRAGYSKKTCGKIGSENLQKPAIQAAIAEQTDKRFKRLEIDADTLVARAETILRADARELTSHHIGACRYCWGQGNLYQWKTPREFDDAVAYAEAKKKPRPTDDGGYGYRITRGPHPACPECDGLGIPYVRFADTSNLSDEGSILFEGVKETKDGLQFMMASKQASFDLLAKHHGLLVQKHEVTGKDGKPIEHDVKVKARVVMVPPKMQAPIETRPIPKDGEAG